MATILQSLLDGKVSTESLICWLKNKSDNGSNQEAVFGADEDRSEFIAYFLNFLRDQTLHLLQHAKSANPSPVKTPSSHKHETPAQKRGGSSSKRVQLFASSPGECRRLEAENDSPLFSPNRSQDSNQFNSRLTHSDKTRPDHNRKRWDGDTPNRRRSSLSQTPETQRSKHKFSLGEFLLTPESGGQKKRGSPYSSREASPSPTAPPNNRRSCGKRKGGSPLIRNQEDVGKDKSNQHGPVFSLVSSNDFPPMGGNDKRDKSKIEPTGSKQAEAAKQPRRIALTPVTKSNPANQSSPFSDAVTAEGDVPSIGGGDNKTRKDSSSLSKKSEVKESKKCTPRRIQPTPVANLPVFSPFSNISESPRVWAGGDAGGGSSSHLTEERELLRQEKARRQQMMRNNPCASPKSSTPSDLFRTPTKSLLERKGSTVEYVQADITLVTHKHQLDVMALLYSQALSEHLFPNLPVELYFLTQLLTSIGEDIKDTPDANQGMITMEMGF